MLPVAYFILFSWPVVAFFLFRRLPREEALVWSILGAYMLLPVGVFIDLPAIPALDKTSVPNIAAFILCFLLLREKIRLVPTNGIAKVAVILFVAAPFVTTLGNGDRVFIGSNSFAGLTIYDAVSALLRQLITVSPLLLGRQFLGTESAHRTMIRVLVVAGLIYSIPMLFEIRFSPQLHILTYGFFPHSFGQAARDGGFRPVVFLGHGLLVALFIAMMFMAAVAVWKARERVFRFPAIFSVAYLGVLVILCKSAGALIFAVLGFVLLAFTGPRIKLMIAASIVLIALSYPILRGADLIPTESLVSSAASNFNEERAESLDFRFTHEDRLLEHANRRPFFGWGGYGRNRPVDEYGRIAITDGYWVIIIGSFGWIGYLGEMGLLCAPILLLAYFSRKRKLQIPPYTLALCLIFAMNVLDLLPNASLRPFTWLLAGAILGYAENVQRGTLTAAGSSPKKRAPPMRTIKSTTRPTGTTVASNTSAQSQ